MGPRSGTGNDQAHIVQAVGHATGARTVHAGEVVATLWSGYGEICRYRLEGADVPSVIVKHVAPPARPRERHGSTRLG